ncbi:MAG: hypothetical protein RBT59_13830 [Arcobacteraceae bacterium]|jgi:hypothetical protein|nr:hypothetical protein [Arcobacteraceae bacterium]
MNIDSFTDEQLLNLINNTIIEKTTFAVIDFTGGYVSITTAYGNTKEVFKVSLLFGYKNRNSQSYIFEIQKDLVFIWLKAILLKIATMQLNDVGMNFNELNALMNVKKEDKREKLSEEKECSYDVRTNVHCTSTSTSIPITIVPPTSLPLDDNSYDAFIESLNIKTFLDMKDFLLLNRKDKDGKQIQFLFEDKFVSISESKLPYFCVSQKNLDFKESDRFYKTMLRELPAVIALIEEKGV